MDLWDRETIDLDGPAFIELNERGGQFRFIAVEGHMDCRSDVHDGKRRIAFTWDGRDDCDATYGRGWIVVETDGSLKCHIYFHHGDDSGFVAVPFVASETRTKTRNPKPRTKRR